MFKRLFVDHPRTVDETYVEHLVFAGSFGLKMIWGGLGAVVHALIPGLCITAGSDMIKTLNDTIVTQRDKKRAATGEMQSIEYII
ncbi:DUF6356 family protein [Parasphingorhabdus sp.]|jgi:hypothetical protein|uniref:DUF6356 family protein n=1 Tax=Parasphingorhabdus sp. TaxID=2709688 RepID=UPI0007F3F707|nr:hypothetical protein A8B75_14630 [Sphingomonadales bacterium EhC05]